MAKGDDKRAQQQIGADRQYMQSQLQPFNQQAGYNYGFGSAANMGDYTDIMNRYRSIADGATSGGAGSVGGGGYSPTLMSARTIGMPGTDFKSYKGFEEMSKTGGYSKDDIANMRARGVGQIRSNYANAEREMSRQRALQGGYSPNFMAASSKMAREQSQGNADALQNLNAGLAQMIQQGKLAGLQGMSPIEQTQFAGELDVNKFNANALMGADQYNASAMNSAAAHNASAGASASAENTANMLRALSGMSSLYGTTPGMSQLFGNQLLQGIGMGGDYNNNAMRNQIAAGSMPSSWDIGMNRVGQIGNIAGGLMYPW